MKAMIFDGELKLSETVPRPAPPPGEALIRVNKAGICRTDLEIIRGYKGFKGILGHEFVGVVAEINDPDRRLLGKRVVGEINCACGRPDCGYCPGNLGRHCPERTTLGIFKRNGCLAEYTTLPLENLFEVPASISDSTAVFTEPLAAGFEILEQVEVPEGADVLILGDGKLGLLVHHALATTGASITQAGRHPEKLRCIEKLGGRSCLIHEMPRQQYDIVVEATGSAGGFGVAVSHVRPRGTLVLKTTLAATAGIDLNPVVVNEITVVGSRCGGFGPALDYLASGVDLSGLVTAVYPPGEGLAAFEKASAPGSLKVIIDFNSRTACPGGVHSGT